MFCPTSLSFKEKQLSRKKFEPSSVCFGLGHFGFQVQFRLIVLGVGSGRVSGLGSVLPSLVCEPSNPLFGIVG